MAYAIDHEVKAIIDSCYAKAKEILTEKRELLDRIAAVLLEREVLDGKEFDALMNGEELPPKPERRNGNGSVSKTEEASSESVSGAEEPRGDTEETAETAVAEGEVPPLPENRTDGLPKDGLVG